jgi:hypothetical protein
MDVRLNMEGVLSLACAVILASAIGFSEVGSGTASCIATVLNGGDALADTGNPQVCDVDERSDAGRGRPGMRFLIN